MWRIYFSFTGQNHALRNKTILGAWFTKLVSGLWIIKYWGVGLRNSVRDKNILVGAWFTKLVSGKIYLDSFCPKRKSHLWLSKSLKILTKWENYRQNNPHGISIVFNRNWVLTEFQDHGISCNYMEFQAHGILKNKTHYTEYFQLHGILLILKKNSLTEYFTLHGILELASRNFGSLHGISGKNRLITRNLWPITRNLGENTHFSG